LKEILEQYAGYNKWANEQIIDTVAALPAELLDQNIQSSFNSLRLTVTICGIQNTSGGSG
jgi:uncharacterized damage-inducible protein DinB